MDNSLTGSYLMQGDGGILYRYQAMWTVSRGKIFWDGKVHRDETLVGTLAGIVPSVPVDVEPALLVKLNMQDAIQMQFSGR